MIKLTNITHINSKRSKGKRLRTLDNGFIKSVPPGGTFMVTEETALKFIGRGLVSTRIDLPKMTVLQVYLMEQSDYDTLIPPVLTPEVKHIPDTTEQKKHLPKRTLRVKNKTTKTKKEESVPEDVSHKMDEADPIVDEFVPEDVPHTKDAVDPIVDEVSVEVDNDGPDAPTKETALPVTDDVDNSRRFKLLLEIGDQVDDKEGHIRTVHHFVLKRYCEALEIDYTRKPEVIEVLLGILRNG